MQNNVVMVVEGAKGKTDNVLLEVLGGEVE